MNPASVPEARIFILLPLGGWLTSKHWSFSYEHWLCSPCVGAQTARLQSVVYKYHLLSLRWWGCLFCTVGGSHKLNKHSMSYNKWQILSRVQAGQCHGNVLNQKAEVASMETTDSHIQCFPINVLPLPFSMHKLLTTKVTKNILWCIIFRFPLMMTELRI
jgi:hypothetical protein